MINLEFAEMSNCLGSKRLGFFYEHNGDAIADFIQKSTVFTYKSITFLVQLDLSFTLGASKNF